MTTRSVSAVIVLLALTIGTARAQSTPQGRVIVEGAVIWRTDTSIVIATARIGTVLELTGRSDRWYEVVVPANLSAGGANRGLIARSQIQLLPGSPEPPVRPLRGGGPTPSPSQTRAPQRPNAPRRPGPILPGFLDVNGTYQSNTTDFQQQGSFALNAEQAGFQTSYTVDRGPSFDIGGGGLITDHLGVGAAVTRFSRSTPSTLVGSVPHPFFFNQPRQVSGVIPGLKREELALHAQVRAVLPVNRHFRVMAFGGPSLFRVTQDVVTDFTVAESYPYDQAAFRSADTTRAKKTRLGFNAGGDASFFFTRRVGVGFTVMFTRAELSLPAANDNTVDVTAGGLQTGAGLRLRF